MITGLDHVQLAMPPGEEASARGFYAGLLGLTELAKPAALAERGGVWFDLPDGRQLHLGVEEGYLAAQKAHPALAASDLDALARTLDAAGYPLTWDDLLAPARRFYTEDPFGNRLEIIER